MEERYNELSLQVSDFLVLTTFGSSCYIFRFINKLQINGPVHFKETLLSTGFDVKKDPSEADYWICKASLVPGPGEKYWPSGHHIFKLKDLFLLTCLCMSVCLRVWKPHTLQSFSGLLEFFQTFIMRGHYKYSKISLVKFPKKSSFGPDGKFWPNCFPNLCRFVSQDWHQGFFFKLCNIAKKSKNFHKVLFCVKWIILAGLWRKVAIFKVAKSQDSL